MRTDSDVNMLLELEEIENAFEAQFSEQSERSRDQLKFVLAVMEIGDNARQLQELFSKDQTFVAMFGNDPKQWVTNIKTFLAKDEVTSNTEGMMLQDFLRWGPFGLLIGMYLRSLGRIKDKLTRTITKLEAMDDVTAAKYLSSKRSLYLPDAFQTIELLKGLRTLQTLIIRISTDPTQFTVAEVSAELRKLGIETGGNPETATDWKAVGASLIGRAIFWLASFSALIALGRGFFGTANHLVRRASYSTGIALGGHLFSDRGAVLTQRGWNRKNLVDAMKMMLEVINDSEGFKVAIHGLETIDVGNISADRRAETFAVATMMKKSFKAYKRLMALIGRGLAAV